ncbi:hypothetical protein L1987_74417 [Smallanthus sonchifolius]|uniref:Uncharacterized protein n=1 Tax=Smallanthus sonchifolius TaxID=185202 RepID=A0ACB9A2Z1_9ASTR|nr:hypothetical protein L1987_74417 [Smallanthus sonchifolius]
MSRFGHVDKGKQLMTKVESEDTSKIKLSKDVEEELSRKAIVELLRQDELEAKAQADANIDKAELTL